mgnify:FL=1
MAGKLKKEKQKVYLSPGNLKRKMIPRIFFMSYLGINVIALTGIPVRARLAMTGEITLRGRVLAIGGLREKLLAAARAGITTVLLPEQNRKDIAEVPKDIIDALQIVFVHNAEEVLNQALVHMPDSKKILPVHEAMLVGAPA